MRVSKNVALQWFGNNAIIGMLVKSTMVFYTTTTVVNPHGQLDLYDVADISGASGRYDSGVTDPF